MTDFSTGVGSLPRIREKGWHHMSERTCRCLRWSILICRVFMVTKVNMGIGGNGAIMSRSVF